MKRNLFCRTIIATAVIGICLYMFFPVKESISLGLGLEEDSHFTIEVALDNVAEEKKADALVKVLTVYRKRIDEIGVVGTTIQQAGQSQIIVQVPGIDTKDAKRIKDIFVRIAHSEFKHIVDVHTEPVVVN